MNSTSWKTTYAGAALAGLAFLQLYQQNGGNLTDWKQWAIPFAIAIIGYLAKDRNATGASVIITGLCVLSLTACTNVERDAALAEAKAAGGRVLKAGEVALENEIQDAVTRHTRPAKQPINVTP